MPAVTPGNGELTAEMRENFRERAAYLKLWARVVT